MGLSQTSRHFEVNVGSFHQPKRQITFLSFLPTFRGGKLPNGRKAQAQMIAVKSASTVYFSQIFEFQLKLATGTFLLPADIHTLTILLAGLINSFSIKNTLALSNGCVADPDSTTYLICHCNYVCVVEAEDAVRQHRRKGEIQKRKQARSNWDMTSSG